MFQKSELYNLLSENAVDHKKIYQLIEEEITKILPPNWQINYKIKRESIHKHNDELKLKDSEWRIVIPKAIGTAEFLQFYFTLEISFDRECLIFYHSHSDAGPLWIGNIIHDASIIKFRALSWYSLSEIMDYLIKNRRHNVSGLS